MGAMGKRAICPMTLREARAFVGQHHRHHEPPQGGLFAIGLAPDDGSEEPAAVAIVGRPVARLLDDDYTVEVVRLCVRPGVFWNACSLLYGACWRAARALGYRRLVTYTLPEEGGASLRGAGFKLVGEAGGGTWARKDRPRVDLHPLQTKWRWEKSEP